MFSITLLNTFPQRVLWRGPATHRLAAPGGPSSWRTAGSEARLRRDNADLHPRGRRLASMVLEIATSASRWVALCSLNPCPHSSGGCRSTRRQHTLGFVFDRKITHERCPSGSAVRCAQRLTSRAR